jgi:hypothetical protein
MADVYSALSGLLQDAASRAVITHSGKEDHRFAEPGQVLGDVPAHTAHTDADGTLG